MQAEWSQKQCRLTCGWEVVDRMLLFFAVLWLALREALCCLWSVMGSLLRCASAGCCVSGQCTPHLLGLSECKARRSTGCLGPVTMPSIAGTKRSHWELCRC